MTDRSDAERGALRAAGALFERRGIQAVGMDAVRDETGLSLKRLYATFATKEGLVVAALDERRRRDLDALESATAVGGRAGVLAAFDLVAAWAEGSAFRGCAFLNAFAEMAPTSPAIAAAVREQKEAIRRRLRTLVADAGGPASLADQLYVLVNGAMVTAALTGTTEPSRDARTAADVLMQAAGLPD